MKRKTIKRLLRQCQERNPNISEETIKSIWLDGYSFGIKSKSENSSHQRGQSCGAITKAMN
jgi:hypothetical protein